MDEPPEIPVPKNAARAATVSALIVVAAFVVAKAGRDAVLLSTYNVKTLPIFIGVSALLSLPMILVTGKLLTHYGPGRLVPILNLVSAAVAVAEWVLLPQYPRAIAVAVFFHLNLSGAVLVSGFWSIVNERFDVQTAKRHIGRIGMGATLGGIFGGVLAERTAVYMKPDKILLVLAAMQLLTAVALYMFRVPPGEERFVAVKGGSTWSAVGTVAKTSLLRNLAMVVVLGSVAAGIMDYVFKADIVGAHSNKELLRSLAIFYTVTNVLTAALQVAFAGSVISRLGVPRSVATLPVTVTLFGVVSLAIPTALAAVVARGAEVIMRNSIYRGAYELIYAPLMEEQKRPTKILLDVGADRIGDILGAQAVGLIVYLSVAPRMGLLIAALGAGAAAAMFAIRLRKSYAASLEQSLIAHMPDAAPSEAAAPVAAERWMRLHDAHTFGHGGDFPNLSLLRIPSKHSSVLLPQAAKPAKPATLEDIVTIVTKLKSDNVDTVKQVLAKPLPAEAAMHVLPLLSRDDLAPSALAALTSLAPRCTGLMIDVLLDPKRDLTLRRRLPGAIVTGDPEHAGWGLWRGLSDPLFEIRYACGARLAQLTAAGWSHRLTQEEIFAAVQRELAVDAETWKSHRLIDELILTPATVEGEDPSVPAGTGLEHVFTVLGLVLPPEPLRVALRAVQTNDPSLRGTALEYLESILPTGVRAQLWPLIDGESDRILERTRDDQAAEASPAESRPRRSADELVAELRTRTSKVMTAQLSDSDTWQATVAEPPKS